MIDYKGMEKKPLGSTPKSTGGQGNGGEMPGTATDMVNNPRGIEPKKHGVVRQPMMQGPVEGKVGK